MKKFSSLFMQDLAITFRNAVFWIFVMMLVIIIALVIFLPEKLDVKAAEYFYDANSEKVFEKVLLDLGLGEDALFDSREAMLQALEKSKKGIGVVFEGDLQDPRFTIYTEGPVAEENLRLMDEVLDLVMANIKGEPVPENFSFEQLHEDTQPVPMNKSVIPIFLVFDAATLGYFFVAVLMFQEKEEGTIRAIRVSPAGTLNYILSKTILYALISLGYGAIATVVAVGFGANYLHLAVLVALASILMTLVGMIVAIFFKSLSEWFFPGALLLIINMMPVVSYAAPVFSPKWIRLIPSYPLIFAVNDILFVPDKQGYMGSLILLLVVEILVVFAVCYPLVHKKLMKDG